MSIAEYGTYGQVLLIVSLFQGVFTLGLSKVIYAFLADKNHKQSTSLYSNIIAVALSGLVASLIILITAPIFSSQFENPAILSLLQIYCWVVPFLLVSTSLNASLIFFGIVRPSATISVICNLIKVVLVIISIQIYQSLTLVFLSILIVEPLRILLLHRNIPDHIKAQKNYSLSNGLKQIQIGWPLAVASMIGIVFYSIDGYMVSSMLDVESFAIYRNGAIQIPFIASIYGAIASILLPDISKYFFKKDFESIVILKRKVITNTAMLIFPPIIFCIIFAQPLIVVYLSEKYIESYPIFMIYSLIMLARCTSYDELFIASNNNNKMPAIYFTALLVNIILNYLLINMLGSIGAAISSVISFYLLTTILLMKGVKFINTNVLELFEVKKLLTALSLCISLGFALYFISLYFQFNQLSLLATLIFYVCFLYHLFLKNKLVASDVIEPLLSKLGDNVLKRVLKNTYL